MNPRSADHTLGWLALALLGSGCLMVMWPFLSPLAWAVVLVSSTWGGFSWLRQRCGGSELWAASLMTLLITWVVLGPVAVLAVALSDDVVQLGNMVTGLVRHGLPDAPHWLQKLPGFGPSLHRYWQQFAHDGQRLMQELAKWAPSAQQFALHAGSVLGRGVLDLAVSVFLAFFIYLHGTALAERVGRALQRMGGTVATPLLELTQGTVSGVIHGVLGTALAQGILAAVGLLLAGVPGAVLLGGATFVLSVIPVGPPLVWGGAAFWLLQQEQTGWAIFMLAWGLLVVSMVDNILKPILISRGAKLPFAVVFLGVMGGVLAFGFIGAFLGPALLAVGFRLLSDWSAPTGKGA